MPSNDDRQATIDVECNIIRAALDGHPVCDVRPDGGIPSCGWKRAVADVRRALDA